MDRNIHQRVLKLRDAALGSRKTVSVSSALARVSYECVVDSLLSLYSECSADQAGLARDKNVARFLSKYGDAVESLYDLRLTAQDFTVKAIIGRGHFGEVQVVHEKSTGDVYAMKVMKKSHILQQADAAFFLEERDIMAWASSSWLTSLHYAFQDHTHLYLVMDFHPGGDLLTVMERNEGGMGEKDTRFYLSEIAMGLHDLHELGFVHRDIKPENVLITRSGHIKLVDFGSAARLDPNGRVLESRLPVGTPEYIAPEVLTSLGQTADYGVCCDWWSLGVIAYELICDVTPFAGKSTAETYNNVMNYKKSLQFPASVQMSDELRGLVSQLLTDPDSRLGFSSLQSHPFFSNTSWDDLLQTVPPYIPTVSSPDDTTNFEEYEPQKDSGEDQFALPSSQTKRAVFGHSLPFVGFTFTRMDSVNLDLTDSKNGVAIERKESGRPRGRGGKRGSQRGGRGRGGGGGAEKELAAMRKTLEASQKEFVELRERKVSLERECVIYQSQLEDYHRKLEIEKVDRRQSDCQALQLLAEVREQGKIAQQLRASEANTTNEQLGKVVEQLEQDRMLASKRARRLQEDLQKMQQERDVAMKKIADYKAKVTEVKQSSRKDINALQTKLAKVTKDSMAKVTEAHSRFADTSKRLQEVESEKRKLEFSLQQAQLDGTISSSETTQDLSKKLEEAENARTTAEKVATDLKHSLEVKEQENDSLHSQCTQLSQQVKELETQWQAASSRQEQLEAGEWSLRRQLGTMETEREEARILRNQAQEKALKLEQLVSKLSSEQQSLKDKIKRAEGVSLQVKREEGVIVAELQAQLEASTKELGETKIQLETLQRDKKASAQIYEELRSLRAQLSETSNLYIAQGDKLREVRRTRLELDQENTNLKMALNKMKSEGKRWEKQLSGAKEELAGLGQMREKNRSLQREIKSLTSTNKEMRKDLEQAHLEKEEAQLMRREAETALRNHKKEMEAQELNVALLQKSLQSVEEELKEVSGAVDEGVGKEEEWKASQEDLRADLETMESRLEGAFREVEKEKNMRTAQEQRISDAMSNLEKAAAAHSEQEQRLMEQFATQKQLACKYSERVSELEKDGRLRQLELREMKKELETEKALASKLYDDLHSLSREHGKLKAAHLKMLQEAQHTELQLTEEAAAKRRVEEERREASAAHEIQETRMQQTIAQQSKLIDFLSTTTPPSRPKLKLKGFKLTRKSRDPAKEMAEWMKIKGMVSKPHKGAVRGPSSPTTSLHIAPSITSTSSTSITSTSSTFITSTSITSTTSLTSQKLTPAIIHLPPAKKFSPGGPGTTKEASGETPQIQEARAISPHPSLRELTVDISRQLTEHKTEEELPTVTPKRAGKKRGVEAATVTPSPGLLSRPGLEHNIPHKFSLKSAPLHKTYVCAVCKTSIKPMHRLMKCNYCGLFCHPKCNDHLPNYCGLPAELVDFDLSQPSSAKRLRRDAGSEEKAESVEEEVDGGEKGGSGSKGKTNKHKKTSSGDILFVSPEATIKFGKVYVPKGEVKSECWLTLTPSSLKCYDRHPLGINRKPLTSFSFNSPTGFVVVLSQVDSRPLSYLSPARYQHLLFAVEEHLVSGVKKAVFVADTMDEKDEWVAAIGRAITECGSRIGQSEERKELTFTSAMPVQSSAMPMQSTVTPVQSSATSVHGSATPVRSSLRIAERGSKWLPSPDKTSFV